MQYIGSRCHPVKVSKRQFISELNPTKALDQGLRQPAHYHPPKSNSQFGSSILFQTSGGTHGFEIHIQRRHMREQILPKRTRNLRRRLILIIRRFRERSLQRPGLAIGAPPRMNRYLLLDFLVCTHNRPE